jgi:hypothetical protein
MNKKDGSGAKRHMAQDGFSSENLKTAFARADGVSSANLQRELAQVRAALAKANTPAVQATQAASKGEKKS